MAKYLVTGGAGFIGSHLVEALLTRGHQVRVLDNFSSGKRGNLVPYREQIELFEGDIRSYHIVREAVDGVDIVFHQGALPSVPRSINDPITTNEVNVGGTLNLLDAARIADVKRLVFASSSSVYGANEDVPKREDMLPEPISPYAVSKLTGEKYCQVFSRTYGLETVSLRYFNVFGPRQDPTSPYAAFIPIFISGMFDGQNLTINGDGSVSRDFTHVRNVVEANLLAAEADDVDGEIFTIACGDSVTLNEVVQRLRELINTQGNIFYGESRIGDVPKSLADVNHARIKLRYHPIMSVWDGLADTVSWYEVHG